jgi:hypothetical protein
LAFSWVYFFCSFDETQSYQNSGSQSVLRGFQGIRDQFLGDPLIHFYSGFSEVDMFLNKKNNVSLKNNRGASLIGGMFISYDGQNV